MSLVLFRLGEAVVLGEISEHTTPVLGLLVRGAKLGGKFHELDGSKVYVHESITFPGELPGPPDGKLVWEEVVARVLFGKLIGEGIQLPDATELLGYNKSRGACMRESSGRTSWLLPHQLTAHKELVTLLAVNAHESKFLRYGGSTSSTSFSLRRFMDVWMKRKPFRDMTRLPEGTQVCIKDYVNGTVTVEADGEPFWLPVEEKGDVVGKAKDDDYYQTLDADGDKYPDPLTSLPSKAAIGDMAVDSKDNWNVQPELHHVAGNFGPQPVVGLPIPDQVKESYGALFYEYDYRSFFPATHNGSTGPPVEESKLVDRLTDALVEGASPAHLVSEGTDYETFKSSYVEAYKKVFGTPPGDDLINTAWRIQVRIGS